MSTSATTPSADWKPLLSGSLQSEALGVAEAITRELSALSLKDLPAGLLEGAPGFALFFEMVARTLNPDMIDKVGECLTEATAAFSRAKYHQLDLHGGLGGLGWVAAHLARRYPTLDVEELCVPVDELLEKEIQQPGWAYPCDIRSGLSGMGLYALERLPSPGARRLLSLMVRKAEETAEVTPEGKTWSMPRTYWYIYGREAQFPNNLYTTGVAHGIPGMVAFLAGAHAAGIEPERTSALLEDAFRWLDSRAQPGHPRFPHYFHGREPVLDDRFSWCVGTPGIIAALWWAARTWGHAGWQERTQEWALHIAREAMELGPVRGSSNLCCGSAGTAQVFLRLHQETQHPLFADAAVRWIQHTLDLRMPDAGIAGYCFEQNPKLLPPNLQFGAAGVALMLLAASTPVEPDWDQCFLFSLKAPTIVAAES
ncbi:MAG: lanthionine synthetase C family protein [Cystobacter sp.]